MTDVRSESKNKKSEILFSIMAPCVIGAFFCFLFLYYGVGQYPDSTTYLSYNTAREPLYPLFLRVCRLLAGETHFLRLAILLQNVLAFLVNWYLYRFIVGKFRFNLLFRITALLVILAPHLLTSVFTPSGIVLTNAVLSEGLTVSLYPLFAVLLLEAFYREQKGWFLAASYGTALLLSLARGQLMTMLLVWLAVSAVAVVRGTMHGRAVHSENGQAQEDGEVLVPGDRKAAEQVSGNRTAEAQAPKEHAEWAHAKRVCAGTVLALFIVTALGFVLRQAAICGYHEAMTDGVVRTNTGGNVTLLTNALYSADEEAVAAATRELSERDAACLRNIYAQMKAQRLCASDAGRGFHERILHHEDSHDKIKFDILGGLLSAGVREEWDALPQELRPDGRVMPVEEDRVAGRLMKAVLPHSIGGFLKTYVYVAAGGFVRTVSLLSPPFSIYAMLIYVVAAALMCYLFKRKEKRDGAWFMAAVFLMITANVCATALTIMCLSRYMIYNMTLFYLAGLVCVWETVGRKSPHKARLVPPAEESPESDGSVRRAEDGA
ncbi:MAG: hypothetical protein NC254_05840 [bacterium]|nr:hypothetical protein [bacterium]